MFRKLGFIGMQKTQEANIKNQIQRKKTIKAKVNVG